MHPMIDEIRQRICALDSNNDGVVDKQEFMAQGGTKQEFSALDKNNDGVLDARELGVHATQLLAARLDSNNDGIVDKNEFVAQGGTRQDFAALDRNNDGVLDAHELAVYATEPLASS